MASVDPAITEQPQAEPPKTGTWRESDRLAALARYAILDTPRERDFDNIVKLVAQAFAAPIAAVNLIAEDRQWSKAEVGIGTRELPLDVSICRHAILQDELMVVPDCTLDQRFAENPLVTAEGGLRFYAGALLKTAEGLPIGTVCVLDRAARPQGITDLQRLTLEVLARQVMTNLELRRILSSQREEESEARIGILRDITAEKDPEHHRRMLSAELQHRMKNTLAVVQSIVSQSLRGAVSVQSASGAIRERLMALGHAHDLLTQTSWTAAPMRAVVEGATRHGAHAGRVQFTGPDLALAPRAALAMSLCLHELSTNAAKYGALSVPDGRVELSWAIKNDDPDGDATLLMSWRELDGPPVLRPDHKGFGTRLMDNLAYDLGGETTLDYAADGVVWQLRSSLARITEPK